jgi:hypothetical protein
MLGNDRDSYPGYLDPGPNVLTTPNMGTSRSWSKHTAVFLGSRLIQALEGWCGLVVKVLDS